MVVVVVAAFAWASSVDAATRTWDGGGADNNWSTAANWSADTLPVAGDTVTFNGTSTKNAMIDVPVTVAIFQVNAGYTGTITQANTLTLTTSYTQSAGTFIGAGPAMSVTGTTTVNSGGTFDGGSSTINLTGALTVNAGGLFTSTSGTLTVTGALTLAAGVFTHNGGTAIFATSNVTLNLGGAATFNAVEFASGTKTISAANTMTVLGTLTLTAGAVNTGTIAAQGDMAVASTFTGGSATLLVNGGGAQAWTGAVAATTSLPVVNINKGGGSLTMTGSFRTTRNWTWTAGTVAAAGSTVAFAGTQTVTGSHTLGAVEVAGGTLTIAAGTTLTVPGTLTLTSGALNTGTLAAGGDISIATAFTGGSATLLINGTAAQTWSGSANGALNTLNPVNINNPVGSLTVTASLRTTRSWTFSASGGLDASASSIIFAGTQTVTGSHILGAVEVSGGTLTIAAGTTLTVGGALNLVSGSVATGTLAARGSIDAQLTYTGGGTGTLLINGTGAQALAGFHTAAAGALPNVDINKGSGTLTLVGTIRTARNWTYTAGTLSPAGSTLIFNGTQTITGSHSLDAVDIRGGTLTIAAGTTLTAAGALNLVSGTVNTGTLAAQGSIDAQLTYTGGGTGTLLIDGSGAQTLTGFHTTATGALPNVNISKPAGTLAIAGTLRTARSWTYTNGGVSAAGSTVIFSSTQTITGSHTLDAVEIRGGTVTIAAGTTITAAGNLNLVSGSLASTGTVAALADIDAASGFTGGTATLLISGGGAQLLSQAAIGTSSLPVVNIAKPGGTLTMSGTFRTIRSWTYTSGGVSAAGTSILFAGTLTISGTHTLGAVEIAGTVTVAGGTTLTAAGNVTLTSGSLSTGTLAAQADIAAAVGFTGGGSATLLIDGSGAQTLTGFHTTAAGSLPNVDISKSGGTLTLAGTIRTARNWTYTAGTLSSAGSTLIFAGTQTVTGSHTLGAVEVSGGTLTIAAGTTLTATGPLNLVSGSVATGTLAAQGSIDAQLTYTGGGTATLLIDGSGAQTLTGFHTAAAGSLPNVDISKSGGTLTLAGTIRTARNWTYTAGTLSPAGSTLIFNGTLTVSGSHTLDAVELHAGDVTVNPGDTLTVPGLLTLTDGNLNGGTIESLGDISLLAGFDGETGTIRIAGTGDQTWTASANTTSSDLADIVIDKPSGTLFLVGTIRMTTASWTWLNGALDPGSSTVYFDSGVTIIGTHSLFNVDLSGGAHTIGSGDVLTVLGTLTLDNGTIDGGTVAGAGPISQLSTFDGGTGLLQVTGASDHTFTGSATTAAGRLPNLEIATSGGTLTLAGTIRTTNDWTHLSGAVDANGSTVVFAGTLTIDAGSMAFNEVLVNAGTATLASSLTVGANLTVSAGTLAIGPNSVFVAGDATIDGALTVTTGLLDMNGLTGQTLGGAAAISLHDLTISDPAGVIQATTVSVAGTLALGGPLTFAGESLSIANPVTGTPNNLAADATSTLIINGSGSGIVIPSSVTALLNLAISNPNGAALAGPLTLDGTLTLAGGNLDAGAFVLSISPPGTVSRTTGHVIGVLQKWAAAGSGVGLSFEIGDATTYAPLALSFGTITVTGQLSASTTAGEHPSIGSSPIYALRDVNRWWSLANAGVSFDTLDVTFTFAPTDVDPGAQTGQFIVAKWDGAWTLPASGANTATTITATGMTSLSEFAIGEPAADLQVSKSGPASTTAGALAGFDYTLLVHNAGPGDNAGGFTVTDTLPAGLTFRAVGSDARCAAIGQVVTCTNSTGLPVGADDSFVIHVTLGAAAAAGTVLANSAAVASTGTGDPDGSNDTSAVVSTLVTTSADLADIVVDSPDPVVAGQLLTYTITITNLGPSDAVGVVLNDLLDPSLSGATYCVDTGSGCGPSSPWTGSVNLGTIAAGSSVVVVISATVAPGTPDGTVIANTASAGATTPDPDSVNNASTSTTLVSVTPATPTPTPTPTGGALPDGALAAAVSSPMVLLFVAWITLLSALAVRGALRRNRRR